MASRVSKGFFEVIVQRVLEYITPLGRLSIVAGGVVVTAGEDISILTIKYLLFDHKLASILKRIKYNK